MSDMLSKLLAARKANENVETQNTQTVVLDSPTVNQFVGLVTNTPIQSPVVDSKEAVVNAKTDSGNQEYETIKANISTLQAMLLSEDPAMALQLRNIHRTLKENPACVTLLEPDEIRVIVNGLEKQTNTYLAQSMTKTSAAKTKSLKNTSMADLGF